MAFKRLVGAAIFRQAATVGILCSYYALRALAPLYVRFKILCSGIAKLLHELIE